MVCEDWHEDLVEHSGRSNEGGSQEQRGGEIDATYELSAQQRAGVLLAVHTSLLLAHQPCKLHV